MKTIELTQGKETIVDDDVYEWANKHKWHAQRSHCTFYAARKEPGHKRYFLSLHRTIMQRDGNDLTGKMVDHRDGNGLNNLRSNLRPATRAQNNANRRGAQKGSKSRFIGVSYKTCEHKWVAQIQIDRKRLWLGRFNTEEAAALARDTFVRQNRLEFYSLNFSLAA